MKKKIILAVIWFSSVVLLVGCGKSESDKDRSGKLIDLLGTTTQSDSGTKTESVTESMKDRDEEKIETEPQPEKDILQTKWQFYRNPETGTEADILIGCDSDGLLSIMLKTSSFEEQDLYFQLSDIRINENTRVPDWSLDYYGKKSKDSEYLNHVVFTSMKEWIQAVQRAEDGLVHRISFNFKMSRIDDKFAKELTLLYEEQIVLEFPEEYRYGSLLDVYLDARADGQTIYEDEKKVIRLLGFGGFPTNYDRGDPHFLYEISNRSDEAISFRINGYIINGKYVSRGDTFSLKANRTEFFNQEISSLGISEQKIESIADISVLITFNTPFYEQDKDIVDNIVTCPIQLSEAGTVSSEREDGTELYHENGIRMSLTDRNRIEDNEKGIVRYEWTLAITNETDKYLEIDSDNPLVNGVGNEDSSPFYLYVDIAPNAMIYSTIEYESDTMEDEPEISFQMYQIDAGNEKLLHHTEQPIVISPK